MDELTDPKILEILLNHIVLPRVLPDGKQLYNNELELLAQMVKTIGEQSKWIPTETVELFNSLKRIHSERHCESNIISNEINRLRPNDSFAMFVERQNSVIFIHMLPEKSLNNKQSHNVVVATFPGCLHPSKIYSNDVEFNYPAQAYKVKCSEMLRSIDFAHQLSMLNDQLPIETKNRDYVSKWLLTVLMDEESETASTNEFPVIKKKIRDELVGSNKMNHFRRSSFHMSTKVILQLSLTIQLGAELSKFQYKIIMLAFMIRMCKMYTNLSSNNVSFNIDLMSQLIAKMARRIEKLSDTKPKSIPGEISNIFDEIICNAKQTIQQIRCKIDRKIQAIHQEDEETSQLSPLTDLNFTSDICQKMTKLRKYLEERKKIAFKNDYSSNFAINSYQRYFKNRRSFSKFEMIGNDRNELERRLYWTDFECYILYMTSLDENLVFELTAVELRSWLSEYATYAHNNYDDNPLLLSRMLLVCLKIIALMDKLAVEQHYLFKEHHTGIETKVFEHLLLPHRKDMKIGYELENYFQQRNHSASYPSLIAQEYPSDESFSVRFARTSSDMIGVRKQILIWDGQNVEEKRKEWTDNRDELEQLRTKISSMKCDYYEYENGKNKNENGEIEYSIDEILHRRYCQKCRLEKFTLQGDKWHRNCCEKCQLVSKAQHFKIMEYEHLLPKRENDQFAVIFELRIPKTIACLREVLYKFANLFPTDFKSLNIKENWVNSRISKYDNSSIDYATKLGSTTKRSMQKFHVDRGIETFIVENTFNCVFHANNRTIPKPVSNEVIKRNLIFKTSKEYIGLQWTLNSTLHTQNQVLSRKSDCPQDLSIAEYVNFGSLRADGHRLQLRKLYSMIETEALSFEKESVLMLIMQTLWECGASGDAKAVRESHFDLNEPLFGSAMIKLLNKFNEQQRNNWNHPLKLLMTTLIAIRTFEMNDSETLAVEIIKLLWTIRTIAMDWITKIEEAIKKIHDDKSSRELRLKIIYVSISGGLTFFAHPAHKHYVAHILANDEGMTAAQFWLYFVITLKNNILLYDERQLPSNMETFLRLIESTGVYLEPRLMELIDSDKSKVHELLQKMWPRARSASKLTSHFHTNFTHILVVKAVLNSNEYTVTIDIINGTFLVNGSPVSRLPSDVTQDKIYQWYFGKVTMEVQPDGVNSFSTVQKYNKCVYEFKKVNRTIIVTERNSNGSECELIPYNILSDDFPILLVEKYSHWWNKTGNCIEFRVNSIEKHFSSKTEINYRFDLNSMHLICLRTQRPMFDVNSHSYKEITARLSRLECSDMIHVFLESSNIAVVELVRMKLKFKVDCSKEIEHRGYYLESNEFSGMRVSCTQKIGTLYGLKNGLVLENSIQQSVNRTKTLLLPHGKIQTACSGSHVSIDIDTREVRNPPFYEYQVDDFCQQLKASDRSHESWFYLAYLHAVTSHGEIEPFTGISGTERALQILQSAFVWSSSPYELDAVEILKEIVKLTPFRDFGKLNGRIQHIQKITWPSNIPNRSAQDSFAFIVKKLLEDSERLRNLYSKNVPNVKFDFKMNSFNERDYNRTIQLQPNLRVSNKIIEENIPTTSLPESIPTSFASNTQTISVLHHKQGFSVPNSLNLKNFLTKSRTLEGTTSITCIQQILNHNSYGSFSDLWIGLYDAIRKQLLNHEQIALILTLFTHRNEEFSAILALQAVARKPELFQKINPPSVGTYYISEGTYCRTSIHNILKSCYSVPYEYRWEWDDLQRERHDSKYRNTLDKATSDITRNWPCDSVDLIDEYDFAAIGFKTANIKINQHLLRWNNNLRLNNFIEAVTKCLRELQSTEFHLPDCVPFATLPAKNWSKYRIDIDAKMHENMTDLKNQIHEAHQIWIQNNSNLIKTPKDWKSVIEQTLYSEKSKHLSQAGLLPRIIPSFLLPRLIDNDIDDTMKSLIGCWALAIVQEQHKKRIEYYSQRSELKHVMNREIENEPHVNWKPCEYPEWLLFEIEQNLTIRRIQIEIAKRMIEPPKKDGVEHKHSVMQLNMGEGKTAVIVPIVAALLADGKQLCQITVLKPLFARNLKFLRQYLGGFLKRRFYTFPCRRDLPLDGYVDQILTMYEECKQVKGVVLTLPEYRLSFQLKIYDSIQRNNIQAAKSFLKAHNWINANVRNILDESDAILQANYQLIYTVGNQMKPDGGEHRWRVIQAILKGVPFHMKNLHQKHGKEKIEFDENSSLRSDVFTPCRILDDSIFDNLRALLIDDFLENRLDVCIPHITSEKNRLKQFLIQNDVDKKLFKMVEGFSSNEQNTIWILCGLLRFEILRLALTKRWRVNYGVDKNGKRRMAIPFKAKDVAAEHTEFGHLDVAICFTQISYYYSGLSDGQLLQIFEKLEAEQNASAIYEKWIDSIRKDLVDTTIVSYSGVNLDDPHQRKVLLFPLLQFNMNVIDYWLSNFVFPHEAKIFENKLMCTVWDLCSVQLVHPVTGFSGTNDTKNNLPLTVAQNDLEELENTNEKMREVLLQPENQAYEYLPANMSGMQILELLTERKIPVLLDSGALVLELTNSQVAIEWLKMIYEDSYDAAVYFDSGDVLQTIDRKGLITDFDCSVYRENLNRCLVYLDDVHTRGTDLKFPQNWKACVTLSGDITRDKTVQSCMRMRQLGRSHSICFWASYEADVRIRKICNLSTKEQVNNKHVVDFVQSNSQRFETFNMSHWSAGALNYTKKLIGHQLHGNLNDSASIQKLYEICVDEEFANLSDMYGEKVQKLLYEIVDAKFSALRRKYISIKEIKSIIQKIQDNVVDKVVDQAPEVMQYSSAIDEEQEKELEQEIEEQRQVERLTRQQPATPMFDKNLQQIILHGATVDIFDKMRAERSLLSITESLSHTKMSEWCENNENAWSDQLFVTKDFKTLLGNRSKVCDEYLRPIWWVAYIEKSHGDPLLVLLSSFECDRLLSSFRKSVNAKLFMLRPRLSKLHSNLLHEPKLQVTGMIETSMIDIHNEAQIGVYAGSMYFKSEAEQNAYCGFLGIIPNPRTEEQKVAAGNGMIVKSNGFVYADNRRCNQSISSCVGRCKFNDCPIDLATKLIEARHQSLIKESHVASILERCRKQAIEETSIPH